MISLTGISKTYQIDNTVLKVLDEINIDIAVGEFVAIMGPSGSGKSTLMNIIGCLDRPTTGSYMLDGMETVMLKDRQLAQIRNKKIGFVFQNFHLLPNLNSLQNIALPLVYAKVPKTQGIKRAENVLNMVGLTNRSTHHPNELSGGQRQRVAIARALANNPSIIIADEPTGNLDTKTGNEIMELFKALNADGKTIILVTHDLDIAKYARRLILIRDGVIVGNEQLCDGRHL